MNFQYQDSSFVNGDSAGLLLYRTKADSHWVTMKKWAVDKSWFNAQLIADTLHFPEQFFYNTTNFYIHPAKDDTTAINMNLKYWLTGPEIDRSDTIETIIDSLQSDSVGWTSLDINALLTRYWVSDLAGETLNIKGTKTTVSDTYTTFIKKPLEDIAKQQAYDICLDKKQSPTDSTAWYVQVPTVIIDGITPTDTTDYLIHRNTGTTLDSHRVDVTSDYAHARFNLEKYGNYTVNDTFVIKIWCGSASWVDSAVIPLNNAYGNAVPGGDADHIADTVLVNSMDAVGIGENNENGLENRLKDFKIYPVPSFNKLYLKNLPKGTQVRVYDITGSHVNDIYSGSRDNNDSKYEWDFRDKLGRKVANGIYFLHAVDESGRKEIQKAVYVK